MHQLWIGVHHNAHNLNNTGHSNVFQSTLTLALTAIEIIRTLGYWPTGNIEVGAAATAPSISVPVQEREQCLDGISNLWLSFSRVQKFEIGTNIAHASFIQSHSR